MASMREMEGNVIELVFNLKVKRKTFVFHMENGNGEMRMLLKIQAARHFSVDEVTFFLLGGVLRPEFLPTIVVVLHCDVPPLEDEREEFTGMANSSWQM